MTDKNQKLKVGDSIHWREGHTVTRPEYRSSTVAKVGRDYYTLESGIRVRISDMRVVLWNRECDGFPSMAAMEERDLAVATAQKLAERVRGCVDIQKIRAIEEILAGP